jgi:threonine dehydratase
MVLVSDERIEAAVETMLLDEHLALEGAACASVAAALERGDELAGQTVVLQISGRNIAGEKLRAVLG